MSRPAGASSTSFAARAMVFSVIMAVVGADVRAERVTLVADRDNSIFDHAANSSGVGPFLRAGRTGGGGGGLIQRGLMRFDCTVIPAGATVESVEVTLTLVGSGGFAEPSTVTLHRVLADWGEGASAGSGGQGSPAQRGDATWLHTFYPDALWTNPGGDFASGASAGQDVGQTLGPVTWGSTAALVADVQGWVDAPSVNDGWIVIGNEIDLNSAKKFASREHTPCPADITGPQGLGISDGNVDSLDFLGLIGQWGTPCVPGPFCEGDITGPKKSPDGNVDALDLVALLSQWGNPGSCPIQSNAPKVTITYTTP